MNVAKFNLLLGQINGSRLSWICVARSISTTPRGYVVAVF